MWPELITHTALADAAIGEGGEIASKDWNGGRRTVPVGTEEVIVLTDYTLLSVLVGLGEYAKRAHVKHRLKALGIMSQGTVIIQGSVPPSATANLAATKDSKVNPHDKGTKAGHTATAAALSIDSTHQFILAELPFAPFKRAQVWAAWPLINAPRLNDKPQKVPTFFYKKALELVNGCPAT